MQKKIPMAEEDSSKLEISLIELMSTIWQGRWIGLSVTVLIVICALLWTLQTATYKSEGFLKFDNPIALSDYERFTASLNIREHFEQYVHDKKLDATPEVNDLSNIFALHKGIAKLIVPVYIVHKQSDNDVLGLRINISNRNPLTAQKMVDLIGRYVMDTIAYQKYSDELMLEIQNVEERMVAIEKEIITHNKDRTDYQRKNAELEKIITRVGQRAHRVISAESVHNLAFITQLVLVEMRIFELSEMIINLKVEKQQAALRYDYYIEAKKLLENSKSGELVLQRTALLLNRMFEDKSFDAKILKNVYNSLLMDNKKASSAYFERSRFVAGPTLPSQTSARFMSTLIGGMLIGFFLSLIIIFGRKWWKDNEIGVGR